MVAGLTMAEEVKRTQATAKPEYTTFRIYVKDGEDISELADKRNKTIAALYHELFSKQVIELLLAETKKRTKDLENRRN